MKKGEKLVGLGILTVYDIVSEIDAALTAIKRGLTGIYLNIPKMAQYRDRR